LFKAPSNSPSVFTRFVFLLKMCPMSFLVRPDFTDSNPPSTLPDAPHHLDFSSCSLPLIVLCFFFLLLPLLCFPLEYFFHPAPFSPSQKTFFRPLCPSCEARLPFLFAETRTCRFPAVRFLWCAYDAPFPFFHQPRPRLPTVTNPLETPPSVARAAFIFSSFFRWRLLSGTSVPSGWLRFSGDDACVSQLHHGPRSDSVLFFFSPFVGFFSLSSFLHP